MLYFWCHNYNSSYSKCPGTINIFRDHIQDPPSKLIQVKVELTQSENVSGSTFGATITIPVIVSAAGTINIFRDHIQDPPSKPIQVKVELTQSEKVPGSTFGATITFTIIVSAAGTINIFRDHIQDPLSKPIQVKVELSQSEMCATITIFVHLMRTLKYRYAPARLLEVGVPAHTLIWRPIGQCT